MPNSFSPLHTISPFLAHILPAKFSVEPVAAGRKEKLVPVTGRKELLIPVPIGTKLLDDSTATVLLADGSKDTETVSLNDAEMSAVLLGSGTMPEIGNDDVGAICRRTTSRFLMSSAGAGAAKARLLRPKTVVKSVVFMLRLQTIVTMVDVIDLDLSFRSSMETEEIAIGIFRRANK